MKKEVKTFWALAARASLPTVLVIVPLMTILEILFFGKQSLKAEALEFAFTHMMIPTVFAISLAVLHCTLCLRGLLDAKNALPVMRLGLPDRAIFVTMAAQCALCLLILWAWQAGLAAVLEVWWCRANAPLVGPHTLFVAFWRSGFLHALLPLGDWVLWIRNIVLCCTLGVCAAKAVLTRRVVGPMILGVLAALLFPASMGKPGLAALEAIVLALICAADFKSGCDFRIAAEPEAGV